MSMSTSLILPDLRRATGEIVWGKWCRCRVGFYWWHEIVEWNRTKYLCNAV